jgi:LEA14-like dessication related protein
MRLWFTLLVVAALAACHPGKTPELRVLGVHDAPLAHEVVFVQVTNPANQSMRLQKLEYTFAADGATVSTGELDLERDVAAGSTVVVEVPLNSDSDASKPMTLQGVLTAELDQIVRTFQVQAQILPH